MKNLLDNVFEATQLTRAGRLEEAVAAIQRGLSAQSVEPQRSNGSSFRDDCIDAHFEVVDEAVADGVAETVIIDGIASPAERSTESSRFIDGVCHSAAGSLNFKLSIPSAYDGVHAIPLIVMLHGCTQNPDDFAAGTQMNRLAEQSPSLVLYPEQSTRANPSRCWNWFQPKDQQRDQGEPAIIAAMTRQIRHDYAVDPQRVFIAGLSAGGAMAAVMAQTYPDLYAAVGIHSGLAYGAANDLVSAMSAMKQGGRPASDSSRPIVPTIVFHGEQDPIVSAVNGEQIIAQYKKNAGQKIVHAETRTERANGGYAYTRTTYRTEAGEILLEFWLVHGAGHAWFGGSSNGSFTDPHGPDASRAMLAFFNRHRMTQV